MTVAEALELYNEGKEACKAGRKELPYDQHSLEARWWTKGWLEEYRKSH